MPEAVGGVYYSPGLVILLSIVTLGTRGAFWTYHTCEDLKKYNGDGLGGALGVVIYIVISPVLMLTIPGEIKNMYERDGPPEPGHRALGSLVLAAAHRQRVIWYLKVQQALNEFWLSKGARPA